MSEKKYDIFISYRRRDTGDKAEHLKDLLDRQHKGRVSFDRENLTGLFDVALAQRIDHCKDFLLVVGKNSFNFNKEDSSPEQVELYNYLGSCTQTEFENKIVEMGPNASIDFVRIEIARALNHKGLNIIPIVPESTDNFSFSKLKLPPDIAGIKRYEAVFYSDHPDRLFKDIMPNLTHRLLSKPDKTILKVAMPFIALGLFGLVALGTHLVIKNRIVQAKTELLAQCDGIVKDKEIDVICRQELNWDPNISGKQLRGIVSILNNMEMVDGGTFIQGAPCNDDGTYDSYWVDPKLETPSFEQTVSDFFIGKYEVSVAEWNDVMGTSYEEDEAQLPISDVSFVQCQAFVEALQNLTGLNFRIPTESEWEYAARGGTTPDSTMLAGSNDPGQVAWYSTNSLQRTHVRNDKAGGLYCNGLDLYDMSGNVCEWCDTPFSPYNPSSPTPDPEAKVIRGGSYSSEAYELTVFHREPMNSKAHTGNVGLRIIIK